LVNITFAFNFKRERAQAQNMRADKLNNNLNVQSTPTVNHIPAKICGRMPLKKGDALKNKITKMNVNAYGRKYTPGGALVVLVL
jgi:hypothetical protein